MAKVKKIIKKTIKKMVKKIKKEDTIIRVRGR